MKGQRKNFFIHGNPIIDSRRAGLDAALGAEAIGQAFSADALILERD